MDGAGIRGEQGLHARPRVEALLDGARTHRLTVLCAPSGFGKTSVLTTWAMESGATWHTLSPADTDTGTLVANITAALRLRVPGLPHQLEAARVTTRGPTTALDAVTRAEVLAALLCQALEQHLRRDVVLVLDDVHVVGSDLESARFLEMLVRQAPPGFHLVLASRLSLPFPVDRLHARDGVLILSGPTLALSRDEVMTWLVTELGPPSHTLADLLHQVTGGWPAAVRLAIEDVRITPGPKRHDRLAALSVAGSFVELARRVLEEEPPEVRLLLRTVAPFGRFTTGMCTALGFEAPAPTLAALVQRGLCIEPAPDDPDTYTVTGLVRDHLCRHELAGQAEIAVTAPRVAAFWEEEGRYADALRALLLASDLTLVRAGLDRYGERLVTTGHADLVIEAVSALDVEGFAAGLEQLVGVAAQLRGEWDLAQRSFEAAAAGLDRLDAGLAWRLGLIHHLRGELDDALAVYGRGVITDGGDDPHGALLLAWSATVHWHRGEADHCAALASQSLRLATAADDPQALAAAHTVLAMLAALEGDRRANDVHYLRAMEFAESAHDVLQMIRIRNNRASHHLEEGAYIDALSELELAIELAELTGFGPFAALALSNRAEVRVRLGDLEQAREDLRAATAIWRSIGSRMVAYPLTRLGDLLLLQGDLEGARRRFAEARQAAEETRDLQGLVPALCGLARTALDADPHEALRLARDAIALGETMGHVEALVIGARAAAAVRDFECASEYACQAARVARSRRDRAGLAEVREVEALLPGADSAALLDESIRLWRELGDPIGLARATLERMRLGGPDGAALTITAVRDRMRTLGCRRLAVAADHLLLDADLRPVAPVTVITLGGFRVLRRGVPVPAGAWQSRKARDLVKILVAHRGRPVPRDVLIELLWPDDTPTRTRNRLNVAVATARAVFDPDRASPTDAFIATDQEALRLVRDQVDVDVERFLADAAAGARLQAAGQDVEAEELLRRAEIVYAGAFLEEDLYEDWSIALREQARASYVDVVMRLAADARRRGDTDSAVRYLFRALEHDAFDERAHLELVAVLDAAGRHGEARRRYLMYDRAMRELSLEPVPFTAAPR